MESAVDRSRGGGVQPQRSCYVQGPRSSLSALGPLTARSHANYAGDGHTQCQARQEAVQEGTARSAHGRRFVSHLPRGPNQVLTDCFARRSGRGAPAPFGGTRGGALRCLSSSGARASARRRHCTSFDATCCVRAVVRVCDGASRVLICIRIPASWPLAGCCAWCAGARSHFCTR